MRPLFYAKEKSRTTPLIYHAWDTETDGLGGLLLCITACVNAPENVALFDGPNAISRFLDFALCAPFAKRKKHVWISHNMSYDVRYIVEYILRHRDEWRIKALGLRTAAQFWHMDFEHMETGLVLRFVDSFAVFPRKLEEFAAQFGGAYKKLGGIDFEKERFNIDNPLHIDYAKRDAAALLVSMRNYAQQVYEDYGVDLGYTASGTSLKAWQRTLHSSNKFWKPTRKANVFFRKAYYGGIVFLTDTSAFENCTTYDINSSYPAQMRKGLPGGQYAQTYEYIRSNERPGFYRCKVKASENLLIPIIPRRDKKGVLRWSRGEFETVCTNLEIDFARKHGYEIETYEGIIFDGYIYPANDYIDLCEKIRKENKGTPREAVAKLMQNGLYGKWGTADLRDEIAIHYDLSDEEYSALINEWTQLDDTPDCVFWTRKTDQYDDVTSIVQWAAWITAQGRITLLDAAYKIGPENVLYGDTDSLTIKSGADISSIAVSDAYGDFKHEKTWSSFRAIAPKTYAGEINGTYKGASKGQRKSKMKEREYQEIFENGSTEVEADQLESLRQVLKKGYVTEAKKQSRVTSDICNALGYRLLSNGKLELREAGDE